MSKVRTRFAVSPTGFLHIGGLRAALFDFLIAKKHGGEFLLRLDDTDQKREVAGAEEAILSGLKWAGFLPDRGFQLDGTQDSLFRQSARKERYLEFAEKLLESGAAYYCFCSAERLEEVREECRAKKLPPRYDRRCAGIPLEEARERISKGEKATIRLRLPDDREVVAKDLVRGEVRWQTRDLSDPVLVKSCGLAVYHLANAVDDHDHEISHAIRGEEWLPSLPLHLLLNEALGFEPPAFAHLPVILNAEGKKLSKRRDSVAVSDFAAAGILPEAMINYLALCGWNPGDGDTREIFSLEDLIEEFSLERVGKSGAIFDPAKLEDLNAKWIRRLPAEELEARLREFLGKS